MKNRKWYKLDNVGKFYSSMYDSNSQNVFRYSATLTEDIDSTILQKALDNTIDIFPNFNVNLKKGIFWAYLEEANKKAIVKEEALPICYKLYNNSNDLLYRISYYKKRINLEVSHILSDGRGSLEFFKTLINYYIVFKYNLKISKSFSNSSYNEKSEDSFLKYYKKPKKNTGVVSNIYYYRGKKMKNKTRFLELHMSLKDMLKLSHENNISLTSLIVSVLIYSFKDVMSEKDLKKNIKIDIPVDLRQFVDSYSSKNYFGLTSVVYKFNSRKDKLKNIMKKIDKQLKENIKVDNILIRVNKMVAFEKNIFLRVSPYFLKNVVLSIIDKFTSHMSTSCVSNIGKIKLEDYLKDFVKNINVLTSTNNFQFTICSYDNDLSIGISSRFKYNDVIKNFCNYFSKNNIDITINSNEV